MASPMSRKLPQIPRRCVACRRRKSVSRMLGKGSPAPHRGAGDRRRPHRAPAAAAQQAPWQRAGYGWGIEVRLPTRPLTSSRSF